MYSLALRTLASNCSFVVCAVTFPRVRDDQNAMLHVIEREHRIEQHEGRLPLRRTQPRIVARPDVGERRLEPGGRVIAEEADRAARQAREIRHERRAKLGHQAAQRHDERLLERLGLACLLQHRAARFRLQDEEGILAEKGIARDPLAAFDALQQEGVVGVLRYFEERGDRREEIRQHLFVDRYEGAPPRQFDELLERRLLHPRRACCRRLRVARVSRL